MSIDVNGTLSSERLFRGAQLTTDMSLGLWQKKQFRAYREFVANTTLVMVCSTPILLTYQSLFLTSGIARAVISTGDTPTGVPSQLFTKYCKNTIDGAVAGNTSISTLTSSTGGGQREVLIAAAGTGVGLGNQHLPMGGPRLLAAGTYYINIVVTGSTSGMYSLEWEELD